MFLFQYTHSFKILSGQNSGYSCRLSCVQNLGILRLNNLAGLGLLNATLNQLEVPPLKKKKKKNIKVLSKNHVVNQLLIIIEESIALRSPCNHKYKCFV